MSSEHLSNTKKLPDFTKRELIEELSARGVFTENTVIHSEIYRFIKELIPTVGPDIVPVRKLGSEYQIGIIKRATGPEAGNYALLGGVLLKDLTIDEAISYHLDKDLGINEFKHFNEGNQWTPFFVQQYVHSPIAPEGFGYDEGKHAIALNYLIEFEDANVTPKEEAGAFCWITEDEIPENTISNHKIVMQKAFEHLKTLSGDEFQD